MTTRKHLVTRLLHQVETIGFPADISECWLHRRRWLLQLLLAISAGLSMSLIAALSDVIWLLFTLRAEILVAFVALDSVVGHVSSCLR